jgi:hypothetical protein
MNPDRPAVDGLDGGDGLALEGQDETGGLEGSEGRLGQLMLPPDHDPNAAFFQYPDQGALGNVLP